MSGSEDDRLDELELDEEELAELGFVINKLKAKTGSENAEEDQAEDDQTEDEEEVLEENIDLQAAPPALRVVRHKPIATPSDDEPNDGIHLVEEPSQMQGVVRNKRKRTADDENKPRSNLVVKLLEKNPLGMTLPEMAGGVRKQKRIRTLRPMLADAIKQGLIMPVSQRAGHTVYKLVKNMGAR